MSLHPSLKFICYLFCLALFSEAVAQNQQSGKSATTYKFDFKRAKPSTGFISVAENARFSSEKGYGYDFENTASDNGSPATAVTAARYFSVSVPEGDYDITLTLGDAKKAGNTTIKAESRRLLLNSVATKPGETIIRKFTIHVKSPLISGNQKVSLKPRELTKLDWDDKLTFEINGEAPSLAALEITRNDKAITVFLAGNSTVVDQDDEPWASWGQMIPSFFKLGVSISNHAESGLSLGSFIGSRRLAKVMSEIKAGDYLFIEFGHNDQKEKGPNDGAYKSYTERLKQFISEAKSKKAIPVLVTPTTRRTFDSTGKMYNSLGDYPAAMKKVAAEEQVALIDLNAMTTQLFQALGPEHSVKAYVHYPAGTFPGQAAALKDDTHFNGFGAYEIARCVVLGIQANHLGLVKYLLHKETFDPGHPDSPDNWKLALSPKSSVVKPDGN